MRVISGTARGLKLHSLQGNSTRPTLDRVKEAVFSMIQNHIYDAAVLDLFAGSGALGIEALSRGAKVAEFVDESAMACEIVRKNLNLSRLDAKAAVFCTDAVSYLKSASKAGKVFDLIFLDPPYAMGLVDEVLGLICSYGILSPDGLIIAELGAGTHLNNKDFTFVKEKKYGTVLINILEAQK